MANGLIIGYYPFLSYFFQYVCEAKKVVANNSNRKYMITCPFFKPVIFTFLIKIPRFITGKKT